jgi:FlaA1/EpsC-like NDP-sugar epimerase
MGLPKDISSQCIICDIREKDKILRIFRRERPEIIFHAAAYKHVPLMEVNIDEAVKNNIFGTEILLKAALKSKCERFILISTDKAVNPKSVLGVTKRVAELLTQAFSQKRTSTKFITVRFGNVLESRGSVVPLFKKQIEEGGPLTVTHPEAVRYFMTLKEASQLVLQASILGNGGEIFVLDMGEKIKIVELAQNMITLSGLTPDVDIKIEFIGLRPGEKLYEELLTTQEGMKMTKHEKIFIAKAEEVDSKELYRLLKPLKGLAKKGKVEKMIKKLKEIVPEYKPQ